MDRKPYASELLASTGEALYGQDWQTPLARELGVHLRTMQRIAAAASAGEPYRISEDVMSRLKARVRERERKLNTKWHELAKGWAA